MKQSAGKDSCDDRTLLVPVFWMAVALAIVPAAWAILASRDLVYDGAYYLLGIAARGTFQLFEPARLMPQILQQGFAVAGARLGVRDLWTLGVLFSLGASGWPVLLTMLCWFVLPRGQKSWIAGPLLNLVFAIPATNFIGISEGIIASCLLWLAFLLVEFRATSPAGALACIAASVACTAAHESAVLCLLVIALAARLHLRDTKGFCRAAMLLVALVTLAGAGNMLRWILFPRSAVERSDFLMGMLGGFFGSPLAPNIAALASTIAAVGCAAAWIFSAKRPWVAVIVTIAMLVILFAVLAAEPAEAIAPSRLFAARGLPVALTTLFAALFLWLRQQGMTPARFAGAPVLAIVLSLAVVQAAMQALATAQWNGYVGALRQLVSTQVGVISHKSAMRFVDPQGYRFRRELLQSWSVEPLSLVLAPQGRVQAFIMAAPQARWVPYDPGKPSTLPHVPGLDWSGFVLRAVR
ncbi:MAG TPA: hypothetical protein VMF67_07155 [Rhizomicrobium sp.]|nr:hypothetical protein [Rhizomicrobium sp.]